MATMYGFFPMTSSPSPDDSDHSVSTACSLSATQPERRNTMQPCRRSFLDVGPARVCPPCCVRPTTCLLPALEGFVHVVDYKPRPFAFGSVSSVLLGLLPCACFSAPHLPGRRSALGDGSPTLIHGLSTFTLPLPSPRSSAPIGSRRLSPAACCAVSTAIDCQHRPNACCVTESTALLRY